jgi:hypothetical protein
MSSLTSQPCNALLRNLIFFRDPGRWPTWPYLPLVRRHPDGRVECGLLYDCRNTSGRYGFSATVFKGNLYTLPATEEEFLRLPREVFDTPDEIAAAGWTVD